MVERATCRRLGSVLPACDWMRISMGWSMRLLHPAWSLLLVVWRPAPAWHARPK